MFRDSYFSKMVYSYKILMLILTAHATVAQDIDQFSVNNAAQRFRDIVLPDQADFQSSQIDRQEDNKFLPRQQTSETRYYNGRQNQNVQGTRDDKNLNYRYAPVNQRLEPFRDEPYIITEKRLREIRSEFMYSFFDKGGSDDNGDLQTHIQETNPQLHKQLYFQIPFFGFRFNYTRIVLHGYLEFSEPSTDFSYPLRFPNKDWPRRNDPSFIGIFFSKCRIGRMRPEEEDKRRPGLYFRMERDLQARKDQFGVELRERLMWDIREGIVGAETFVPKHTIIVTWKNVTFTGGIENARYVTNTFQLVLATDEVLTYVIFNYGEMQWISHTEAGGDSLTGAGGVPAYVGFNAGNGTRSYEYYPYSQRSTITDLVGQGWANGFPGRHIFRIDENIMLGNCNKDVSGTTLPLVFAPESGNMLGGMIVNLTGPCFEPNMKITCKFDTEEVVGRVIDRTRAVCVQPFLKVEGYIIFDISINNGKYNWKGQYFVETPATAIPKISIESEAIHKAEQNDKITITWNKHNITTNYDVKLKLSIWGYKETTSVPVFTYIDVLEDNIPNTGSYIIYPELYAQRNNYKHLDITFGFLQINVTEPAKYFKYGLSPVLWSRPIPLGWYFAPQWEREYGKQWSEKLCDDWLRSDRYLKNFAAELPTCPCVLEHAFVDKGRYLPDYDCDIEANPSCYYNKGARHCVRTGAPNLEGSEQQCCYDKNNYLMLSYDQQWGSKPRRSHNLGYLPWNEISKVPTLSQWFHDISPFYSCCLWQEEQAVGCETYRFERRPSQDCNAYQPPYVATVFGDPHFITFDDVEYTFNGKGEFVLVHADSNKHKLDIQGRFEQVDRNIYGPVMATQLTSVAARDNVSTIIEVKLRPKHAQWRYRLDILADGKRIYFDRSALKLQHFRGVTVYTPSYILNQSEVIIMFETGAGVEVVENKGSMSVRVYLPWNFINRTRGLLGTWNFNQFDEFTLPDGTLAAAERGNFWSVHNNFGMHWLLEDRYERYKGGALFFREYGRTASYYANKTFVAEMGRTPQEIIPLNRSQDIVRTNRICGESYQCKYDFSVSLDEELAKNTLKFQNEFINIKTRNKERVITCGILETPRFGRKSNFLFTPGTKVTYECYKDFVLIGDQRRTCTAEGMWDVPEYGYTECLRLIEYQSRVAWSSIAIISLVIVPLLILLCCFLNITYRMSRKEGTNSFLNFTSSPALRRRSSILALSTMNLSENNYLERVPLRKTNSNPELTNRTSTSFVSASVVDSQQLLTMSSQSSRSSLLSDDRTHSTHSMVSPGETKKKRRKYDGVYRTNEPLPGKPLIEFEEKVWDLDDEYNRANEQAMKPWMYKKNTRNGQQEFSSRTLWFVIPIVLLILGPLLVCMTCVGYRLVIRYMKSSTRNNQIIRNGSAEILADTPETSNLRQEM